MLYLSLFVAAALCLANRMHESPSDNIIALGDHVPSFKSVREVSQLVGRSTCSTSSPCANGACCSKYGYCGWSGPYCGTGNCTSNCSAQKQCGPLIGLDCPLNVCCSSAGTCGTTTNACVTSCLSGYGSCGTLARPSCSGSSASARTVGYYQGYAASRSCDASQPTGLNVTGLTDLVYAFAFFDTTQFTITPTASATEALYSGITALKKTKSSLRTWIGIGGATYSQELDASGKYEAWSTMASTAANRAAFISNLGTFMKQYSFNGVNLDWEYPFNTDGRWADTSNFVSLVSEMNAAFGKTYGISVNLPASYSNLQYFNVSAMAPYVTWFNFMAYNLHSPTDGTDQVWPATNLTEIDGYLDPLWRAGITPSQLILGSAYYSHSYTLSNSSCTTPGCASNGAGTAGNCSQSAGVLYNAELGAIISKYSLKPFLSTTAAVKWITWDVNQWASYDDYQTLALKRAFASERCMGGLSIWSVDQDNPLKDKMGLAGTGTVFSD